MFMLCSVTGQGLKLSVISHDWDLETDDVVTCHNILEHVWLDACLLSSIFDRHLHVFEELWLSCQSFDYSWRTLSEANIIISSSLLLRGDREIA